MKISRDFVTPDDWGLVVLVDKVLFDYNSEDLSRFLVAIYHRWNVKISLVASGLNSLPINLACKLIECSAIHGIYCGGVAGYECNDAVIVAKRVGARKNVFIPLSILVKNWAAIFRFFVQSSFSTNTTWFEQGLGLFACDSDYIEYLPENKINECYSDWYHRCVEVLIERCQAAEEELLRYSIFNRNVECPVVEFETNSSELYVSSEGLVRFDGWLIFSSSKVKFGGVCVGDFSVAYQIDLRDSRAIDFNKVFANRHNDQIAKLPSFIINNFNDRFVVDVVPSFTYFESRNNEEFLCFPRQVLQIRRFSNLEKIQVDSKVFFISSNYNKEKYIHAGIYSVMMQTHPGVTLFLQDDCSTDGSEQEYARFINVFPSAKKYIVFFKSVVSRGTYWIRNHAFYRNKNEIDLLGLVSDSDDVSSLQRAVLHDSVLSKSTDVYASFMDVVRVDAGYRPIKLDKNIERYGTASLALRSNLIKEVGYFEVIKKNADTEFIERVKIAKGDNAVCWSRYPVLFQVYDGNNLTADIYSHLESGNLIANHNSRALHTAYYRKEHRKITNKNISIRYDFPRSSITSDYLSLGKSFCVDGYIGVDQLLVVTGLCITRLSEFKGKKISLIGKLSLARSAHNDGYVFSANGVENRIGVRLSDFMTHLLVSKIFFGYLVVDLSGNNISKVKGKDLPFEAFGYHILSLKTVADKKVLVGSMDVQKGFDLVDVDVFLKILSRNVGNDLFFIIHSSAVTNCISVAIENFFRLGEKVY